MNLGSDFKRRKMPVPDGLSQQAGNGTLAAMNHMLNLATANIYPLARVARCKRRGQRWSVAGVWVLLTLCGLLGHQAWAGDSKSAQTTAAASSAPADLKTMRERARRAGKALVLEFGAKWCGPCVAFDRNVLPNRKVQAALSSVVFVHYDAEQHPGQAAARALGIVGYPTFVALAQDGTEISRLQGYRDAEEFTRWIQSVATDSESMEVIQARATSQTADAESLLLYARRLLRNKDESQALQYFDQAKTAATGKNESVAAAADWEGKLIRLKRVLREEPRKTAIEHLQQHPRGPSADTAMNALSRLGPADAPSKQAMARYVDAHLESGQEEQLNLAIYSCLRAAAFDEAERAARRLISLDGNNVLYLDTMAEVMHLRGDRDTALKLEAQALASTPPGTSNQALRSTLEKNQARFARGKRELPDELKGEPDELLPWEKD